MEPHLFGPLCSQLVVDLNFRNLELAVPTLFSHYFDFSSIPFSLTYWPAYLHLNFHSTMIQIPHFDFTTPLRVTVAAFCHSLVFTFS